MNQLNELKDYKGQIRLEARSALFIPIVADLRRRLLAQDRQVSVDRRPTRNCFLRARHTGLRRECLSRAEDFLFDIVRLRIEFHRADLFIVYGFLSISTPLTELVDDLGKPHVVETYDFKLWSPQYRRLDLRVAKVDGGSLELYAAYKNKMKRFVANWVFLEGCSHRRRSPTIIYNCIL